MSLTWGEFAQQRPDLASFGLPRIGLGVMYLATLRADGYPRVHPLTPFVAEDHLMAFMEPRSPKARDLQRDGGRYSLHSLVVDSNGTNGEFQLTGRARLLDQLANRELATRHCPYTPKPRYVLFEFAVEGCLANEYIDGAPNPRRWSCS